jgi:heme-degrading monooxygenase HmoA
MTSPRFASLPAPPYYAVIFTNQRGKADPAGYAATADRMVELAALQPGFLGVESTRDAEGFGITVSYWADEASIRAWKANAEHRIAQETGMERWYEHYETRVAKVERAYASKATESCV